MPAQRHKVEYCRYVLLTRVSEELRGILSAPIDMPGSPRVVDELCEGIVRGLEYRVVGWSNLAAWVEESSVTLDVSDYSLALALAIRRSFTRGVRDFYHSRRRDWAQAVTDILRHYLAEIGFVKWLRERLGVRVSTHWRDGVALVEVEAGSSIKRFTVAESRLDGVWIAKSWQELAKLGLPLVAHVRVGVGIYHFLSVVKSSSIMVEALETASRYGFNPADIIREIQKVPLPTRFLVQVVGFEASSRYRGSFDPDCIDAGVEHGRIVIRSYRGYWEKSQRFIEKVLNAAFKRRLRGGAASPDKITLAYLGESLAALANTPIILVNSRCVAKRLKDWEGSLLG